jgi:hypothetical protein
MCWLTFDCDSVSKCPSINGLFAQSAGGGQVFALYSKNNPRNIKHMPACPVGPRENTGTGPADRTGVVIFFACLDLEQKSSFMDGH